MSLAIGLDVSELRLGWAVVDYDSQRPLALGVEDLRMADGGWPEDQVLRAVSHVAQAADRLGETHDRYEAYVVGIEDVYRGPSIKGTIRHAGIVGMATMAARVVFGPSVTYWPIPNGTWLNPLGIKPASRKRADLKAATLAWAAERLEDFDYPGSHAISEDAADALGIATACAMLTERREAA